jgi:maltose O-acetyltransferase
MRSERDKMLAGEWYHASDPELQTLSVKAQRLLRDLNATPNENVNRRAELLRELFGGFGAETEVRSPFYCDYGNQITIGTHGFVNYNCVILDVAKVTIGDYAQIGPGVQIYTAYHPVEPALRKSGAEAGKPVVIGNNVWLGGGAIICPGVKIGDNAVIGAGSVVTCDISEGVVAVGNPSRAIRNASR